MGLRFGFILLVLTLLILGSCGPAAPLGDQSVLIITVANFGADSLGCGSSTDSVTPKLDEICNESVRFTHAYTPSVLVTPALASLLTGLYPVEIGVHRNDAGRYNDGVISLPQAAREKGLETILVSGGVPVLRKTPVSKGFDDFDDSIRVNGSFYRPADEVAKRFLSLLESRSDGTPFFGVLHLADLQFPENVSQNASQSERREGNATGKLQEIDEAIGNLRDKLKKMRLWDPLTVVIVGLQGQETAEHNQLSKGINLYDEVVRVPLLVKPSRKPSDHAPSWKVDAPMSLADLGLTLFHYLGVTDVPVSRLRTKNFLMALYGRDVPTDENRPLFSESDLPAWRNWGPRLLTMRIGETVYFPTSETKLFNTYTDRNEQHNLFGVESRLFAHINDQWASVKNLLSDKVEGSKYFLPRSIPEKLEVARVLASRVSAYAEKLRKLNALEIHRPDDWQVLQWKVQLLIEAQNWIDLKVLLRDLTPHDEDQIHELKVWKTFVALKLKLEVTQADTPSLDCLFLAVALKRFSLAELDQYLSKNQCQDQEIGFWVRAFVDHRQRRFKQSAAFSEMAKAITERRLEQVEFAKAFWFDGAVWDYKDSLPAGPSNYDLFVALVTNQDFINFVRRK